MEAMEDITFNFYATNALCYSYSMALIFEYRPSGVVTREASSCTKSPGFESRVRHGCQNYPSLVPPMAEWFCPQKLVDGK